jgi:secreted PhoX family phosphatase
MPRSLQAVVAANPSRRAVLKGGFGLLLLQAFGLSAAGCEGAAPEISMPPDPPGPMLPLRYDITFQPVAESLADEVSVPEGYTAELLFSSGDAVVAGSRGYSGTPQPSSETELQAGGNHDGMHFFELPGVDPQRGGLLAVNHENPDYRILFPSGAFDPATATAEQKRIALSAVGVSVIEIELVSGKWRIKKDSPYNKRYTGNTVYTVGGPAAPGVGPTVIGTLNNCSSGHTPWGTYLTCEEAIENGYDRSQPAQGYGWVVEIDPQGQLTPPKKRTTMGRFPHENTAFLTDAQNHIAFYMGNDSAPGCIYKFVPEKPFDSSDRAKNADLLDAGTLYVARFNADGSGEWRALVYGENGLYEAAFDPGDYSQGTASPQRVDFFSQADVLINTRSAGRVAGGTVMDRPEWVTVGPDGSCYCTLTNNSGRQVTDAANPRVNNRHGHIVKWRETEDSPLATTFRWELFVLAGDPSLQNPEGNLVGDIAGDTFSSPDGIRVDPKGRLWVQTDSSTGSGSGIAGQSIGQVFGNNGLYSIDPQTRQSRRFLVGPIGCEITGIAYTPDLTTFFINIQHPSAWPDPKKEPRSSTLVIRRRDGQPVGA